MCTIMSFFLSVFTGGPADLSAVTQEETNLVKPGWFSLQSFSYDFRSDFEPFSYKEVRLILSSVTGCIIASFNRIESPSIKSVRFRTYKRMVFQVLALSCFYSTTTCCTTVHVPKLRFIAYSTLQTLSLGGKLPNIKRKATIQGKAREYSNIEGHYEVSAPRVDVARI